MNEPDDLYPDAQRERASVRAWRWALALLVVVLVASVAAFVVTGPLASGDDEPTSDRAGIARPPVIPTIDSATGGAAPAECRTPLTPDDPLRLWIGGDSLAGSLGPSLGAMTGATGVVQPTFHSKVSSGLESKDFYDWPQHAPEDLVKYDPEVAVFWIGTNDAKAAPQDVADDDAWRDDYTVRVEEMLQTLIGDGRTVYWVGAPVVKEKSFAERVKVVNEVAAAVVAKHPEAHYVDAFTLFSDPDGGYAATLPDTDGKSVQVRAGDGVHLTPDGGDVIGHALYEHLESRCDLEEQAVPGEAKETVEVRSGSQTSGTRRPASPATTSAPATTVVTTTAPTVVTTTPPTATTVPATIPVTTRPPPTYPPCFPYCNGGQSTTPR
jgi:hypothetical protein